MARDYAVRWGVLIRSDNKLNGKRERLEFDRLMPTMFLTRQEARDWINVKWGYLRNRPDLKAEPHGWKMPIPVRVKTVPVSWLNQNPTQRRG